MPKKVRSSFGASCLDPGKPGGSVRSTSPGKFAVEGPGGHMHSMIPSAISCSSATVGMII